MSGKHLLSAQSGALHGEVKSQDITISGTYPTAIPPVKLASRKRLTVLNKTGVSIWLGGADVTQYNGIELANGTEYSANLGRAQLYAVTASTTVSGVRTLEIA